MNDKYLKYENEIIDLIRKILFEYSLALKQVGITKDNIKTSSSNEINENYWSEVEVSFWKGNNLVDVLETFIWREGKPIANKDEFEEWFRENITNILYEMRVKMKR